MNHEAGQSTRVEGIFGQDINVTTNAVEGLFGRLKKYLRQLHFLDLSCAKRDQLDVRKFELCKLCWYAKYQCGQTRQSIDASKSEIVGELLV